MGVRELSQLFSEPGDASASGKGGGAGRRNRRPGIRLNVFPITIPALRHRKGDIPDLVHHFVDQKSKELKITALPAFMPGVMDRLMNHHWPGNIRELANAVERELILRKEQDGQFTLIFEELGPSPKKPMLNESGPTQNEPLPLDAYVKIHIERTLEKTKGKISGTGGAAEILQINPGTLRSKMKKLGISYGRNRRPSQKRTKT